MFQKAYERLRAAQAARLQAAGSEGAEVEGSAEAGFTLIELMVVLLIMGILMAIAIPTFLGVTGSAKDKAAQSNLTNALTEAQAYYTNQQSYTGINTSSYLPKSEPQFTFKFEANCTTAISNCVSFDRFHVVSATGQYSGIILAAPSATGTCWYVASLQTNPASPAGTLAATAAAPFNWDDSATAAAGVQVGSTGATISSAGTFYGADTGAGNASACNADYPLSTGSAKLTKGFTWYSGYGPAGSHPNP